MTIGILACQLTFPRPGQRIPAILTATLTGGIATGVLGVTLIERGESNVKKVFELSGFTSIMKFYPDVQSAVASYKR